MRIRGKLYKAARILGDYQALTSGKPVKLLNRGKNKFVGKKTNKLWRWPF